MLKKKLISFSFSFDSGNKIQIAVLYLSHLCLSCHPTNCRSPGSSSYGVSQARILEWVAISSSREPSQSSLLHSKSHEANSKILIGCSICTLGMYYVHRCEYTQKQTLQNKKMKQISLLQVSTDLGIRDKI